MIYPTDRHATSALADLGTSTSSSTPFPPTRATYLSAVTGSAFSPSVRASTVPRPPIMDFSRSAQPLSTRDSSVPRPPPMDFPRSVQMLSLMDIPPLLWSRAWICSRDRGSGSRCGRWWSQWPRVVTLDPSPRSLAATLTFLHMAALTTKEIETFLPMLWRSWRGPHHGEKIQDEIDCRLATGSLELAFKLFLLHLDSSEDESLVGDAIDLRSDEVLDIAFEGKDTTRDPRRDTFEARMTKVLELSVASLFMTD